MFTKEDICTMSLENPNTQPKIEQLATNPWSEIAAAAYSTRQQSEGSKLADNSVSYTSIFKSLNEAAKSNIQVQHLLDNNSNFKKLHVTKPHKDDILKNYKK